MIEECEAMMPRFLMTPKRFPKWLIIRRGQDSKTFGGEQNQWQGFIKQIKKHFEKETSLIKSEFNAQKTLINQSQKDIKYINSTQTEMREEMKEIKIQNQKIIEMLSEIKGKK